jgi:hypothetical protein
MRGGEGAETLIGCAGALRRQDEGGFHSWPARTGEECESARQRKARLGLAVVESPVERAEAIRAGHVDPGVDNMLLVTGDGPGRAQSGGQKEHEAKNFDSRE